MMTADDTETQRVEVVTLTQAERESLAWRTTGDASNAHHPDMAGLVFAVEQMTAARAAGDDLAVERHIVHVTEIRLSTDDPWSVCNVGVYPIVNGLEGTIATLSDRLDAELDRQKETERERWVTRTLGGKLREVRVETVHGDGESYFRHRIMRSDNGWLTPRIARTLPTEEAK